ncbi:MAG: hypothetical protein AAF907_18245 [Planctomycetota bacterium]
MDLPKLPIVEPPGPEPKSASPAFTKLVESKRAWLEEVLKPWCRTADLAALRLAEANWIDLAGNVDPQKTLWLWAWGRFEGVVSEELEGFEESLALRLTLKSGETVVGFPDGRASRAEGIVLIAEDGSTATAALDEIASAVPA